MVKSQQKQSQDDESDDVLEKILRFGNVRDFDDYISKQKKVSFFFRVTRYVSHLFVQQEVGSSETVVMGVHPKGTRKLVQSPEARGCARYISHTLRSSIKRPAYKIVRRVEPPIDYNLENVVVGLSVSMQFGFDIWRQLYMEY